MTTYIETLGTYGGEKFKLQTTKWGEDDAALIKDILFRDNGAAFVAEFPDTIEAEINRTIAELLRTGSIMVLSPTPGRVRIEARCNATVVFTHKDEGTLAQATFKKGMG